MSRFQAPSDELALVGFSCRLAAAIKPAGNLRLPRDPKRALEDIQAVQREILASRVVQVTSLCQKRRAGSVIAALDPPYQCVAFRRNAPMKYRYTIIALRRKT